MVVARFRRTEPHRIVMAGNHIHFHAERGYGKIVNDVFAGHDQSHVAIDRDVQFINFAAAVGLFELPHPLFADDVDVKRVGRRVAVVHVNDGAPAEHSHQEEKRQNDPGNFQAHVAVDGRANVTGGFALVAEEKVDDSDGDRHREKDTDRDDEQHEAVKVRSEVGGRFRIKWQMRLHGLSVLLGGANSDVPRRVRGGGKS